MILSSSHPHLYEITAHTYEDGEYHYEVDDCRKTLREQINWVMGNIPQEEEPRCLLRAIDAAALTVPFGEPSLEQYTIFEPIIASNMERLSEAIIWFPILLPRYIAYQPLAFMFSDRSDEIMMTMRWG